MRWDNREVFVRAERLDSPQAPIVFLHDSLGCVELWRDFPAALGAACGRGVICFDRPGHGRSEARAEPPRRGFIEHDGGLVPALLDALGVPACVLFGHSVGGSMALAAAAALGGRCLGTVTEGSQAFMEPRTLAGIRAAVAKQDGTVERLARYHGAKARAVFDAWTRTWLAPDFADWSLAPVLARVRSPVLALHGEHDEFGSLAHARMIADGCGGRAHFLPGAGHVPHRERPDEVIALVAAFFAGLAP